MGKDAPAAPDYTAAAKEQGQASKELTEYQTWANRPDITTPWGTQKWTYTPGGTPGTAATPGSLDNNAYQAALSAWEAQPEQIEQVSEGGTYFLPGRGARPSADQFTVGGTAATAGTEGPGSWESNIELSPDQQEALSAQMRIQTGRSNAAETLLGQATSAFQKPMDWASLGDMQTGTPLGAFSSSPTATKTVGSPIQGSVDRGGIQSSVDRGPIQGFVDRGSVQGSIDGTAPVTGGPIQGSVGDAGNIQQSLTSSAGDWRQKGQSAIEQLMAPQLAARRSALETRLANQGITMGSDAWNTAMRQAGDDETRAGLQAIDAGRTESDSLFSKDLQSGQFANTAQQQKFAQMLSGGQFANSAQAQDFSQRMGSADQQFSQNAARGQFANTAQAQDFNQGVTQGQFANSAQAQDFNQGVTQGQFANSAQAQDFNQGLNQGQFANSAQAQDFAQRSTADQQYFDNQMKSASRDDTNTTRTFDAGMQSAQAQNLNRQQALAELLQRRGQPLNELNALLTQQQVAMPQMPSFQPAGRAETPNLVGAAQNQYSAALDASNADNAGIAGLMGGLFGLGSAAIANPAGLSGLFNLSDKRLKKDISHVFTLANKIKIYKYRFIGSERMELGVLAQEVQEIMPEAVAVDSQGFLRVNYDMVLA